MGLCFGLYWHERFWLSWPIGHQLFPGIRWTRTSPDMPLFGLFDFIILQVGRWVKGSGGKRVSLSLRASSALVRAFKHQVPWLEPSDKWVVDGSGSCNLLLSLWADELRVLAFELMQPYAEPPGRWAGGSSLRANGLPVRAFGLMQLCADPSSFPMFKPTGTRCLLFTLQDLLCSKFWAQGIICWLLLTYYARH